MTKVLIATSGVDRRATGSNTIPSGRYEKNRNEVFESGRVKSE
jgi:hypothetical protein